MFLQMLQYHSVHPHVHGELPKSAWCSCSVNGSSPRAWGTQVIPLLVLLVLRFIPTCMGNSNLCVMILRLIPVHPHVHGELDKVLCYKNTKLGSSPRAWGTLTLRRILLHFSRFIPTCMGNSAARRSRRPGTSVHPHVHGELREIVIAFDADDGSSPRAWGTLFIMYPKTDTTRFIPTCMGNSSIFY